MPIYTIAEYEVRASGIETVKSAIAEFVPYIQANEPGTRLYVAWQSEDKPTRFVHFFIFADESARKAHASSTAVKRFEESYRPELASERVSFTNYTLVAGVGI
jgi:quinol monooxygenase YgiN